MGTDNADIAWLLAAAGRRLAPRELRGTQSGYYTALSVVLSAREATKHIGLELSACRVAIEGLGRVGSPLATLLRAAGARVVAVSTTRIPASGFAVNDRYGIPDAPEASPGCG